MRFKFFFVKNVYGAMEILKELETKQSAQRNR